MAYNYTNLHFFDKDGNELPIVFDSNFKVEILKKKDPNLTYHEVQNQYDDNALFYGVVDPENNVSFFCQYQGGRYKSTDVENGSALCKVYLGDEEITGSAEITSAQAEYYSGYTDSTDSEYVVTGVQNINVDHRNFGIGFPSVTFKTGLSFNKVSTELVETQSIYVLGEENNEFKKVSDLSGAAEFFERYKLLFFIDCRKQEDFRFFDASNDEIVWANKEIIDFANGDFRVNIGFKTSVEGVYEEEVYVCLIDTLEGDDENDNMIYPIGSIHLSGEAIGEDERYRALFTNFGIPHPKDYMNAYSDTDIDEGYTDNITMNNKAKQMFLAYHEIFPYAGTYKALVNAVKILGYNDVFFKEWYKEIGKTISQGGYVNYDMSFGASLNANTINNISLEERIRLKKLNWISMVYKINEEIAEKGEDKYGFPYVERVHAYNDVTILVKLIALRDWLQKYIIGLNCRIIDIGGEGIYFERYRLDAYSTYQTLIEWNNEHNIAPYVEDTEDGTVLVDSSAHILVNLGINSSSTLEDIQKDKFISYCDGYIDENNVYHHMTSAIGDSSLYTYVGGTFECKDLLSTYEIKASSKTNNFLFGQEFLMDEYNPETDKDKEIYDSSVSCASFVVAENEIIFNPYDVFTGKKKNTIFKKCPVIMIEKAVLRVFSDTWKSSERYSIYPDLREDTKESYFIKNSITGEIQSTVDYVTFIPPKLVSENDTAIKLKPFNSARTITIDRFIYPNIHSDFEEANHVYRKNNMTYGLKYSDENKYNMPFFIIRGYQIDKIDHNIDINTDYILEILDGKMMFIDEENDRKIYLNFNYDTSSSKQTVEVNIEYNSEDFNVISFDNDGDEISHFIDGNDYESFTKLYKEDPETAITYEFTHNICVRNTGEFTVDVIGRDEHNNIFAANCDGKPIVTMPEFSIKTYANKLVEGVENPVIANNDELQNSYIDFCIYKPTYLIPDISVNIVTGSRTFDNDPETAGSYVEDSISITYPSYSYSLYTPAAGDYVHFVNITDKYNPALLDNLSTNTNAKSNDVNTYESFTLALEPGSVSHFGRVIERNDYDAIAALNNDVYPDDDYAMDSSSSVSDYVSKFYDSSFNYSNVNLIFYNELGGYPINQLYADMVNDGAFFKNTPGIKDKYTGTYRIGVEDDSWRGYVWTSLKNNVAQKLAWELAMSFEQNSPAYLSHEYKLVKEVISINEEGEEETNIEVTPLEMVFNGEGADTMRYSVANVILNNYKFGTESIGNNDSQKISVGLITNTEIINAQSEFEAQLLSLDDNIDWYGEDEYHADREDSSVSIRYTYNGKVVYYPFYLKNTSNALKSDATNLYLPYAEYVYEEGTNNKVVAYKYINLLYTAGLLESHCTFNDNLDTEVEKLYNILLLEVDGESVISSILNELMNVSTINNDVYSYAYKFLKIYPDFDYRKKYNIDDRVLYDDTIYSNTGENPLYTEEDMPDDFDEMVAHKFNKYNWVPILENVSDYNFDISTNIHNALYLVDNGLCDRTVNNENEVLYCKYLNTAFTSYSGESFKILPEFLKAVIKVCLKALHNNNVYEPYIISNALSSLYVELSGLTELFKDVFATYLSDKSIYAILANDGNIIYKDGDNIIEGTEEMIAQNYASTILGLFMSMNDIRINTTEISNFNAIKYTSITFTVYAYIMARLIQNFSRIVNEFTPEYKLDKVNNEITYKHCDIGEDDIDTLYGRFLMVTDPDLVSRSYQFANDIVTNTHAFFYADMDDSSLGSMIYAMYPLTDEDYSDESIDIYSKVLVNKSYYIFEALQEENYITKGEVHVNNNKHNDPVFAVVAKNDSSTSETSIYTDDIDTISIDDISVVDSVSVTDESDEAVEESNEFDNEGEVCYVKRNGFQQTGYKTISTELPENAGTSIEDMLGSGYISMYIKPTWEAEVKISMIDTSTFMYEKLDPNYDYIYASYKYSYFKTAFNIGEKVKIITKSAVSDKYIGQATYEVVGYDILNSGVILKGYMNPEYLNKDENQLWVKIATEFNSETGLYNVLKEVHVSAGDDTSSLIEREDGYGHTKYYQRTEQEINEHTAYIRVKARVPILGNASDDVFESASNLFIRQLSLNTFLSKYERLYVVDKSLEELNEDPDLYYANGLSSRILMRPQDCEDYDDYMTLYGQDYSNMKNYKSIMDKIFDSLMDLTQEELDAMDSSIAILDGLTGLAFTDYLAAEELMHQWDASALADFFEWVRRKAKYERNYDYIAEYRRVPCDDAVKDGNDKIVDVIHYKNMWVKVEKYTGTSDKVPTGEVATSFINSTNPSKEEFLASIDYINSLYDVREANGYKFNWRGGVPHILHIYNNPSELKNTATLVNDSSVLFTTQMLTEIASMSSNITGSMRILKMVIDRGKLGIVIANSSKFTETNGPEKKDQIIGYNNIVVNIPIKSEMTEVTIENPEDPDNPITSFERVFYHKAYYILRDGTKAYPVTIYSKVSEKVNTFISYSHHAYVDYPMKVIDGVENPNGTTTINVEATGLNMKIADFLDDTFALTSNNFDIGEGLGAWMSYKRNTIKINDSTPDILNDTIYEYENTSLTLTQDDHFIAFSVDLDGTGIDPETSYNYWKVYKKTKLDSESKFMFESFNPVLYLDYDEPGIYDIEAYVFDKFGNLTTKMFKGAYKIV